MHSDDRTPLDQRLVEHVERGEWLDLVGDKPVDTQAMRAWGQDRVISAAVLRDIIRGVATDKPDPRGVRLRGARVRGCLDLAFITSSVPVALNDCVFENGLNAVEATLPVLELDGCLIEHAAHAIPLRATGLTTSTLRLRDATVSATGSADAVVLSGAELGDLDCWGATISAENGTALAADELRVRRKALLGGGFTATSVDGDAAVTLDNAELGEVLFLKATLHNDDGVALSAENVRVHRHLMLRSGFTASGTAKLGTVNLEGAELGELVYPEPLHRDDIWHGPGPDHDRMGAATAGVGLRHAVHRRLHECRPEDLVS